MPKLDANKIEQANRIIQQLVKQDKEKRFTLKPGARLKLAHNLRYLHQSRTDFVAEHTALIEKYGTPMEGNPGQFEVKRDSVNWAAFESEYNSLAKTEMEIDLQPLTGDELFNEKSGASNQIEVDLLADLITVGLLEEKAA